MAAGLVEEFLGDRITAPGCPPGLREAVIDLTVTALATQEFDQLIEQQLDQLRHPSSAAAPDAYLALDAVVEDALQHAAAGIRLAAARNGHIVEPHSFERHAARRLGDDPRLAIRAELARVARPPTRPAPLLWSIPPAPWAVDSRSDDRWPPPGIDTTRSLRRLDGDVASLARVEDGPRAEWIQIGMLERQRTPSRRYPDRPERVVLVAVGLEIGDTEPPQRAAPFTALPWQYWITPWRRIDPAVNADTAATTLAADDGPAVGLVSDRPRITGLGEPRFLLVPAPSLIAALGLESTPGVCGFSLSDRHGPALVGLLWRGYLVHDGNYHPLSPAVEGADLLLRPDLAHRLRHLAGDSRLRAGVLVSSHTGEGAGEHADPTD